MVVRRWQGLQIEAVEYSVTVSAKKLNTNINVVFLMEAKRHLLGFVG